LPGKNIRSLNVVKEESGSLKEGKGLNPISAGRAQKKENPPDLEGSTLLVRQKRVFEGKERSARTTNSERGKRVFVYPGGDVLAKEGKGV